MENPNTWDEPTKMIESCLAEAQRQASLPPNQRVIGLSLARRIRDALANAGYLNMVR